MKMKIAVATAQGYGELTDVEYICPSDQDEGFSKFNQKNGLFHAGLTVATAKGMAITKVDKFKKTHDGVRAWTELLNYYEGQGSSESIAKWAMNTLHSYKLTRSTP